MEESQLLPVVAGSNSVLDYVLMPITAAVSLLQGLGQILLRFFKSSLQRVSSLLSRDLGLASWFHESSRIIVHMIRTDVNVRFVSNLVEPWLERTIRKSKIVPEIYDCLQANVKSWVKGLWKPPCLLQRLKEAMRDSPWKGLQLEILKRHTTIFAAALRDDESRMKSRVQVHILNAKQDLGFNKGLSSLTANEKQLVNEKVFQYAVADIESETCSREAEDHCLKEAREDRYEDISAEACKKKFKENTRDRALARLEETECPSSMVLVMLNQHGPWSDLTTV